MRLLTAFLASIVPYAHAPAAPTAACGFLSKEARIPHPVVPAISEGLSSADAEVAAKSTLDNAANSTDRIFIDRSYCNV